MPLRARLARSRKSVGAVFLSRAAVSLAALGGTVAGYAVFSAHPSWQSPALRGFSVVLLTLLPGFLYLRFLRFRLRPLWIEYVYNLHRLGIDLPGNLPQPPRGSQAWARWSADGGEEHGERDLIYRSKFRTQYGRSPRSDEEEANTPLDGLATIYLCMLVLGVGWAATIWHVHAPTQSTPRLDEALRYAFLGAYFYVLSDLLRRYFQNDLRPGAYMSSLVRVVTVLILVAGVDQSWQYLDTPADRPSAGLNVTAFIIGIFPAVALQILRRTVARITGIRSSGGLQPSLPLRQLDGVDVWTEGRLLEVGIEDAQHIASANFVDVLLGTNITADRIVSWVDQALLLVHAGLPRSDNAKPESLYRQLRVLGIRSATDLLAFVEDWNLQTDPDEFWPTRTTKPAPALTEALGGVSVLARAASIARLLRNDPNLRLVVHWQHDEQDPAGDDQVVRLPTPAPRRDVDAVEGASR